MTSRRHRLGRLAVVLLVASASTGCAVGRPQAFTARSNSFCSDALTAIGELDAPTSTLQQMQYATDRYTIVEKAVSELTDSSLPGGQAGRDLRSRWLQPARADLLQGRQSLGALRDALRAGNPDAATSAFASARTVGTAGVDTALLTAKGLDRCATLFTAAARP